MNVHFEDKALEELYLDGKSTDKRYKKLSRDSKFMKAYARAIDIMYIEERAKDLSNYSYLHYEQLKGRPESSIRIMNGRVERLIFTEHEDGIEVKLLELDLNHYGKKDKKLIPFVANHPGSVLKEELEARGISQKEFAKRIGILPPNLNDVIHGRRNVTEQLAMKLEEALGIPFKSWINLQSRYNYLIKKGVPASLSESRSESTSTQKSLKKQILAQLSLITDDDAALASCLKYMKILVRQSKHQEVGTFVQEPPATYK